MSLSVSTKFSWVSLGVAVPSPKPPALCLSVSNGVSNGAACCARNYVCFPVFYNLTTRGRSGVGCRTVVKMQDCRAEAELVEKDTVNPRRAVWEGPSAGDVRATWENVDREPPVGRLARPVQSTVRARLSTTRSPSSEARPPHLCPVHEGVPTLHDGQSSVSHSAVTPIF